MFFKSHYYINRNNIDVMGLFWHTTFTFANILVNFALIWSLSREPGVSSKHRAEWYLNKYPSRTKGVIPKITMSKVIWSSKPCANIQIYIYLFKWKIKNIYLICYCNFLKEILSYFVSLLVLKVFVYLNEKQYL